MKKIYKIAVIPGDGIGPEVTEEGCKILDAISSVDKDITFQMDYFLWGSEHYLKFGSMMPEDWMDQLAGYDAIYFGAVGSSEVPEEIAVRELVIKIRQKFDQYVNLRPIYLISEEFCPIKGKTPEDVNITFIRENTQGEYSNIGQIYDFHSPEAFAMQTSLFTRKGTERIMKYAFELANKRGGSITNISKSNALNYSMVFWDKIFEEIGNKYPNVQQNTLLVDAAALLMVLRPERFDVVVASNLFGDILTDLGAALQGGLGFAASANIDPSRKYPSMFEPVHGSAPDIAGTGKANPIASLWTVSLMLDWLGENTWSSFIQEVIKTVVLDKGIRTPDINGNHTTKQVGDAVKNELLKTYDSLNAV